MAPSSKESGSPTPAQILEAPDTSNNNTVLPTRSDPARVAIVVLAILGSILILQFAQAVFIPMVLSVLVSYALDPMVSLLARWRVPRPIGAAVVLVAAASLVGYGVYSLSDDALAIVDSLPGAAQKLRQTLRSRPAGEEGVIQKVQRAASEIEQTAKEAAGSQTAPPRGVTLVQIEEKPIDIRSYIRWGGSSLAAFMVQLALVLFFVYFMLMSGDLFKRKLVKIAGSSLVRRRLTIQALDEITKQIERFLVVQLSACVVVAVFCGLAFRWIGLERAILWGITAGVLTLIPYFGAVIITVLVGLASFLQFGTLSMTLLAAGVAFAIRGLETFLITPWLMGRAARMNGVAVFAGLMFWGWIWGAWGMFLAVPMMVAIKAVCDRIDELNPIGELMGK